MSDFSTILSNRFIGRTYKSSLGFDKSTFYRNNSWGYSQYSTISSDYIKKKEKVRDLLRTAYKSVHDSIVILDFPFKTEITFSSDKFIRVSRNDKVTLFIPTSILDSSNPSLTTGDKLDYICGTGVHEASHLKYTELRTINNYFNSLGIITDRMRSAKACLCEVIFNILEDERVENRLLTERPGYEIYIKNLKDTDYLLSQYLKNSYSDKVEELFKELCIYIRFRSKFNVKDSVLDSRFLDDIDKMIEPIYSDSQVNTKKVCQITNDVVDYLLKKSFDVFDEELFEKLYKSRLNNQDFDFFREVFVGKDETISNDEFLLSKTSKQVTKTLSSQEISDFCEVLSGEILELSDKVYIKKNNSCPDYLLDRYNAIRKKVSPYTSALRKILLSKNQNYDFNLQGCRSGLLDTTKLAEAYQGDPHVYVRQGHVRTNSIAICVLIDESGSMGCYHRDEIARETAILLNESFSNLPGVELFIYGHTADVQDYGSTDLTLYKDPSIKNPVGLINIQARDENRDGMAILSCAAEVRKKTKSHCIMFVISDGSPCAFEYYGAPANKDTRDKINKVRKTMDMDVIGILIESYVSSSNIYGDDLIDFSDDLRSFSNNLAKLVTKVALKRKNTNLSYT